MPLSPEIKRALWWMAPINFDGHPIGAFVRSAETVAAGVGTMLVLNTLGIDCGGPIAVGTLLIMGGQFSMTPRHNRDVLSKRQRFWKIKAQYHEGDEDDH